jgi:hypothetical protein
MKTALELLKQANSAYRAGDQETLRSICASDLDYQLGSWKASGVDELLDLVLAFSDGRIAMFHMPETYEEVIESSDGSCCWALIHWHYVKADGTKGIQELASFAQCADGKLLANRNYGDLSAVMGY